MLTAKLLRALKKRAKANPWPPPEEKELPEAMQQSILVLIEKMKAQKAKKAAEKQMEKEKGAKPLPFESHAPVGHLHCPASCPMRCIVCSRHGVVGPTWDRCEACIGKSLPAPVYQHGGTGPQQRRTPLRPLSPGEVAKLEMEAERADAAEAAEAGATDRCLLSLDDLPRNARENAQE